MKCELCLRPLTPISTSNHHLMPKMFGGNIFVVIPLHKICHQKIHSTFSEHELKNYYNLVERLLEHEEIQKFVKWVKSKPPDFYDKSDDTKIRKRKRKR